MTYPHTHTDSPQLTPAHHRHRCATDVEHSRPTRTRHSVSFFASGVAGGGVAAFRDEGALNAGLGFGRAGVMRILCTAITLVLASLGFRGSVRQHRAFTFTVSTPAPVYLVTHIYYPHYIGWLQLPRHDTLPPAAPKTTPHTFTLPTAAGSSCNGTTRFHRLHPGFTHILTLTTSADSSYNGTARFHRRHPGRTRNFTYYIG